MRFYRPARAFSFFDQCPYGDCYAPAGLVMLDWGKEVTRSSFVYDPTAHRYLRFAGAKGDGAPFSSFASADDRAPEHMEQLGFENLIIQRVEYEYVNQWKLCPRAQCVGAGYADIFIDGRYIPGFWVRQSAESPTVLLDDQGNELLLRRGKTYISLLSPGCLLAYAAQSKDRIANSLPLRYNRPMGWARPGREFGTREASHHGLSGKL